MAPLAFLIGLAFGIGFWLCQELWTAKQLRQMLAMLQKETTNVSLPIMSRLRRAIALSNQQRQQLESELQTWQQLLQVAPIGFVQVDEENQLLWCNQQAQQLLQIQNWQPGKARLLLKFVRSYELDQLIEQTREQQQPGVREWLFHPANPDAETVGRRRSLTLRCSSWPLPHGEVGVFLENRQPLVELAQNRDRWVSDLAHELRTPLTSIRLVAEMLQGRLEPPWNDRVERLLGEINRLIQLVQDWLELSHLDMKPDHTLSRQPLELRSFIHSVWQTLEPLARQKQLTLLYSGPDSIFLNANESGITRVLINIFDNSIRYSPPQGIIQAVVSFLSTQEENLVESTVEKPNIENQPMQNFIYIDIIDQGPGFPETDLPRVFERLYRGDPARTRPIGVQSNSEQERTLMTTGSGLGLAIVQQIIQSHGGSVKARNHPDTGGAWLQIHLPCV